MTKKELAKFFDHTNLNPTATKLDIKKLCDEAKKYGFFSVCMHPCYVLWAKMCLEGSKVKVCTVIGFPLGASITDVKVFETKEAIKDGADEIDMVINIGALKINHPIVEESIRKVVKAAKGKIVKAIIECCYLTDEEKRRACKIAKKAGAHFVKTSTGFGPSGATVKDVKLMKKAFGGDVKAAGGIRTLKDALAMIKAGATRLGCSASVEIMEEFERSKNVI